MEISKWAHDEALHYLMHSVESLADVERYQLTQVIRGYTGRCNQAAARRGIAWLRRQARCRVQV